MQIDTRPRFGWTDDIDLDPQHIYEREHADGDKYVVVIALPNRSPKLREKIRDFCKTLHQR